MPERERKRLQDQAKANSAADTQESTGISEPLPAAEPRLGRRTALTFPLFAPPQKN